MTTLITGASSGIGLELAAIFAREGYDLVLVARRADRLETLKQSIISKHAVHVQLIVQDLSDDTAAQRVVDALEDRSIDILVNNAGSGDVGMFAQADVEKTQHLMHLNILALTSLTQLLLPSMIARQSGKILNVASVAAFMPGPKMAVYFASKAYVLSFSEALSNELQNSGVTVTTLCPGATSTEFDTAAGVNWGAKYHRTLPSAEVVAQFGYIALMNGKQIAIFGWTNRAIVFFIRFFPRSFVTKIARMWVE